MDTIVAVSEVASLLKQLFEGLGYRLLIESVELLLTSRLVSSGNLERLFPQHLHRIEI